MVAINGYFDGNVCIPFSTDQIRPRQKVIITVLDEFLPEKRDLKKYVGKISAADSDLIAQAVNQGRQVDIDEW